MSRRTRIVLRGLALLVATALVAGVVYEQLGRRRDRRLLPQIGKSVDIGGRTRQAVADQQVWIYEMQAGLARLSTHGRQIVVPEGANHGTIPQELIINAIRKVVTQVRGESVSH